MHRAKNQDHSHEMRHIYGVYFCVSENIKVCVYICVCVCVCVSVCVTIPKIGNGNIKGALLAFKQWLALNISIVGGSESHLSDCFWLFASKFW